MAIFNDNRKSTKDKNYGKTSEKSDDAYEGEANDDIYLGGSDDDFINDQLFGGPRESQLGDEEVSGDGFNRSFSAENLIYNVTINQGKPIFYDGDATNEKLILQVTEEQWQQSWLQTAIADFEEFINQARPGDIFDFSIYDAAGRYLQLKAANIQAVLIELLTGGSRSTSEEDSMSDGDVAV